MPARRLVGLDGVRGVAALYVVVYHAFLRAFPGYPAGPAPWWAAFLGYGRFAVVVFIVLSGFSLAVAPARHGWRLDGKRAFARRRAYRILPAYWAALVFSLLLTWFVTAQPGWPLPTARSVVVNGLLVQDAIDAPSPNRAFWSIAIEAQLYVVFPLLLLLVRRVSATVMVAAVAGGVVALGVWGPPSMIARYTPDLAVLFAIGVAAAGIVGASARVRKLPWHWFAAAAAAPVLALIAVRGTRWTLGHLFWVDLALGPAVGCLLAAIAVGRPRPLVGALDTRPLRSLGSFSYSLYLTHSPIVIVVFYALVAPWVPTGPPALLAQLVILLPVALLFARGFAEVFEIPFQRRGALADQRHVERVGAPAGLGGEVAGVRVGQVDPGRHPLDHGHAEVV